MLELTFWSSLIFVFYSYFGYPLLLWLISQIRDKPVKKLDIKPSVSCIITAYNEEDRIQEKIENTLRQDYPAGKLEIIVASDCSTDKTDGIVKSYQSRGVTLVRAPERKGKENAQKYAVEVSSGNVLVFSDVATILPSDAISTIVKNFHDPTVGCASSVDRVLDSHRGISGEGAYVRYEMFLRTLETKVNTLVGLSGSFFAARREVCQNWSVDLQSDFNTLLHAVKKGLRGVSDPDSVGYYKNIVDESKEFERKVRTVSRGISVFMATLPMLNPFRYNLFSWQLFSHKFCRWLVPFAMILAFFTNTLLIYNSTFYLYILMIQMAFYSLALGERQINLPARHHYLKIPSYLLLANLSILTAWYRYVRGEQFISWRPSER